MKWEVLSDSSESRQPAPAMDCPPAWVCRTECFAVDWLGLVRGDLGWGEVDLVACLAVPISHHPTNT